MLRLPTRAVARSAQSSLAPARTTFGRRFLTTDPPHLRSRSWKSSAARWGIAIAGIYYYNTSPIFAEQPGSNLLNPNLEALDEEASGTSLEALTSRQRRQQRDKSVLESAAEAASTENASTSAQLQLQPGSPEQLEEEADQQGAFNPETGEINWDCPCLGGMAHGPCGPEFREAFSCFVYSTEEPKGMECIDKFQGMQTCFQKHPDIYQSELMDDEDEGTMDEGMKAEREELAKEIKERREKLGTAEDTPPQRRLLEEPETAPVKAATTKGTPNARTAPSETQKPTRTPKAPGSASPASPAKSTEKPMPEAKLNIGAGQPSEHEDLNEGQSSQLIREPAPSPVQSSTSMGFGDEVGELVPKAAHDASDAKALDQEKKA